MKRYKSNHNSLSRYGFDFRCYLLDGISKGAWLNRSSIIYAGNDKWSGDPRVSIVSNVGDKHEYSLQIQKVDVTDEGLYTCSIQSERNPRPKLIQLIVKGKCYCITVTIAIFVVDVWKISPLYMRVILCKLNIIDDIKSC